MSEKPQIDYILVQKSDFKSACDVIGSEECVSQYKLTNRDLELNKHHHNENYGSCQIQKSVQKNVRTKSRGSNKITNCLPNTSDIAYGWTLDAMPRRKETCWSNGLINCVIKKKS